MSILGTIVSGVLVAAIIASVGLAIAAGLTTTRYIQSLSLSEVIAQLKEYKSIKKEDDLNRVGFQLKQTAESGHHQIIVGIWDEKSREVKAATIFDAETLDDELKNADELVIYN